MKTPSRSMSCAPLAKGKWWSWPVFAVFLVGAGYWIFQIPGILPVLAGFGLLFAIPVLRDIRYWRDLAESRKDESICNFARGFPRGETDTWILRAVYEELSQYLVVGGKALPVCPMDRLAEDLWIDPEDLEDLVRNIAFRARRSLTAIEENPLFGKVRTVADLARLLEGQPRTLDDGQFANLPTASAEKEKLNRGWRG